MAVSKLWAVNSRLGQVIDYAAMEQNLETIRAEEEKQQRKEQKRNDKFR